METVWMDIVAMVAAGLADKLEEGGGSPGGLDGGILRGTEEKDSQEAKREKKRRRSEATRLLTDN